MYSSSSGISNQITLSDIIELCRREHEWTQTDLARAAHVSIAVIQSAETNAGTVDTSSIVAISAALNVDLIEAYRRAQNRNNPTNITLDRAKIIPFVTATIAIHQNSFEWTEDGVLLDVADHAPHLSLLPTKIIKRFIGKKIPLHFRQQLKQKATAVIRTAGPTPKSDVTAITRPADLWSHYQRLIHAARDDEYSAPFNYQAKIANGKTLLRQVKCIKLNSRRFETQTRVVSQSRSLDLSCCGQYDDCRKCLSVDADRVLSVIKKVS